VSGAGAGAAGTGNASPRRTMSFNESNADPEEQARILLFQVERER
jgi:hypothetical protein